MPPEKTACDCPECGKALPPNAPAGLCRACLVGNIFSPDDELEPSPADATASGSIGDYDLIEPLARGAMGIVYRARQRSLDREVAVKLILEGRLAGDAEIQRFQQEANAAAGLDHPNIVPIHEVGEEDGQHFYSMRLIESGDLSNWIEQNRNADNIRDRQTRAAELLGKAARAIGPRPPARHPPPRSQAANILIDERGEPQISDFGLARNLNTESALTMSGQVLGSPAYMAPEQGRGEKELSPATDVFALGAMLYQLTTGSVPFEGNTPIEVVHKVIHEEPRPPRAVANGIDREIESITLKALEKSPTIATPRRPRSPTTSTAGFAVSPSRRNPSPPAAASPSGSAVTPRAPH